MTTSAKSKKALPKLGDTYSISLDDESEYEKE
jgi:hypothetical protein